MTDSADPLPGSPRRAFLGQLAATAAGLGVAACAGPANAAVATTARPAPTARASVAWDDSWTHRLGNQHRFVIEGADMDSAPGRVALANDLYSWYHEALGVRDSDMHIVLVLRHRAIPMVFNDVIWAKYNLGDSLKLKDSAGEPVKRNPYFRTDQDDKSSVVRAATSIAALQQRGVIILGCNMAVSGYSSQLASRTKSDADTIGKELRANLLPGVILQLNGVYAVTRAQDAGCVYYKGANT
jgi:hypothetical protein